MADVELLPLVGTLRALPEHVQGVVQAYGHANVAHHTAALRAEVELWRHKAAVHKYRRERLAEELRAARRALAFAAQHLPECNEPYERANAALAQEDRNG